MTEDKWTKDWLRMFPKANSGKIKGIRYIEMHYDHYYNIDDLIEWARKNKIHFDNIVDKLWMEFPNMTADCAKDVLKVYNERDYL